MIHATHEHARTLCTPSPQRSESVVGGTLDRIREIAERGDDVVIEAADEQFIFTFDEILSRPVRPASETSRLSQLHDILQLSQAVFRLSGIISFFALPQPILGHRSALHVLLCADLQTVRAALISAYEGGGR